MNKNTLNAALKRLADFKDSSEEEIKAAIAADEKGFSEEEQAEIYAAFTSDGSEEEQQGNTSKKDAYTVAKSFNDINDFNQVWEEGDDVSHFEKARLDHLLSIGYIKKA